MPVVCCFAFLWENNALSLDYFIRTLKNNGYKIISPTTEFVKGLIFGYKFDTFPNTILCKI